MASPFYEDVTHVRLSNSSQNSLRGCGRKFEFRKLLGHPAHDDSLAAAVGQCLHEAYQDWCVHQDADHAKFRLLETYPFYLNVNSNDNYSIYACVSAFESMLSHAELASHEIAMLDLPDGRRMPAIEVPFEFKIKNFSLSDTRLVTVSYVGKTDQILYDRVDQSYIVTDTKSTRLNMIDMSSKYLFDEQLIPYGIVLEKLLGHPIETFKVKYLSVYLDLMKAKTEVYSFMKSKNDIRDWATGLVNDLFSLKSSFNSGWFRRNHNSCSAFNRVCAYIEMCQERDHKTLKEWVAAERLGFIQPDDPFPKPWIAMDLDLGFPELEIAA